MVPTVQVELDRTVSALRHAADAWANADIEERIELLSSMREPALANAAEWVQRACDAKGIRRDSPLAAEEWITGPWALLYAVNRYIRTLTDIKNVGHVTLPRAGVHSRPGGQIIARVFPVNVFDKLFLSGVEIDVWMQPGVTAATLPATIAPFYRENVHEGRTTLVLGAGNIASIPPLDVLYKMIADGAVCMLKMNPVNEYLGPIFERIFSPFIARSFLKIVYGGAEVGAYLCEHPGIDEIHMTGSAATHDAIVFGAGEEGAARKAHGSPRLQKPISSELGNVSPTIVLPGRWSSADLAFQAQNIVTQKMHNAGFNCIAAQVLVVPEQWDQTDALLAEIERVFVESEGRAGYYPGAHARHARLLESTPNARVFECGDPAALAPALLELDAGLTGHPAFTTEAFSSVLAVVRLRGETAETFYENALRFCNEKLAGTLGATIVVDPATERRLGERFEDGIAALRYGSVGVNIWAAVNFLLTEATWGAYPGNTLDDVQSGIGVVHNAYLFSRAQKSVVRGPFYPFPRGVAHGQFAMLPKPPWFVTNRTAAETARRLTEFEARPGWSHVPGILTAALLG